MIDNPRSNIPRWGVVKKLSGEEHTSKKSADRKPLRLDQKRTGPLFPEIRSPNPKVDSYRSPEIKDKNQKIVPMPEPFNRKNSKSKGEPQPRSNITPTPSPNTTFSPPPPPHLPTPQPIHQHPSPLKPLLEQSGLICGMPLFIENLMEVPEVAEPNMEKREEEERKNILELSPKKFMNKDKSQPFEKWKKGNLIGSGSTSDVYKILDENTGVIAAGKNITKFPNDDPELMKSIKSQLDIMCKLEHPNIVKFYKYVEQPTQIWFFMQYLPQTLQMIYSNYGPILPSVCRQYTKQLLSAVKYLHDNKIIHKDIKCSNILIGSDGTIKLSDFGSSKRLDQSTSANLAATFKGSVRWMAPEVITENNYGRKSDIWSVGCAVLEMVTGKVPWFNKDYDNPVTAIFDIGKSEDIPIIPEDLPQSLIEFLRMCLVRDSDKRASIEQLLQSRFFNQ